jgi:hypothetical protein
MSSIIYNLYKNLEGYYLSYFKVDYLVKEICYILDNFYFYEENEKSNYSGYFNKNYRINYNIKVYNIKKITLYSLLLNKWIKSVNNYKKQNEYDYNKRTAKRRKFINGFIYSDEQNKPKIIYDDLKVEHIVKLFENAMKEEEKFENNDVKFDLVRFIHNKISILLRSHCVDYYSFRLSFENFYEKKKYRLRNLIKYTLQKSEIEGINGDSFIFTENSKILIKLNFSSIKKDIYNKYLIQKVKNEKENISLRKKMLRESKFKMFIISDYEIKNYDDNKYTSLKVLYDHNKKGSNKIVKEYELKIKNSLLKNINPIDNSVILDGKELQYCTTWSVWYSIRKIQFDFIEKKVDEPKPMIEENFSLNLGVLDLDEFKNYNNDELAKEAHVSHVFRVNEFLSTEIHDVGYLKTEFELNKKCSKIMNDYEEKINLL